MSTDKLSELNDKIPEVFDRVIEKAEIKDIPGIIKALSQVDFETERDVYIQKLIKKFKIGISGIKKDIKNISSKPEMKKKKSLTSLTPPVILIEVIKTNGGLKYCLSDYEVKDSLEINGVIHRPPDSCDLVCLPTDNFFKIGLEDSDKLLFDDIEKFIYQHLDVQDKFAYKVLTLWVFHTWLIDRFTTSPIIHFLGPYASGKSRGGDVLSILARRGLSTVNLTGAPIFRVSALYQPTFIIDEVKLTGKDRDRDILELLNARFQRGRKVIRINTDKTGLDSIQEFDVFGATVLSGLDELPETPRSRSLVFVMEQNVRPVEKNLDIKRAEVLRDRLCAFRARHLEERMPNVERCTKEGRLGDAIEPLHQILKISKLAIEPEFAQFFRKLEKERKEETFDSFDAEMVRALLECRDKVEQGKILVSYVTDSFNEGKNEPDRLSIRSIGRVLTRLGLKKTRTTGGIHARFWDEKRIERLCKKYGLSDVSDESDDSDVKTGEGEKLLKTIDEPKPVESQGNSTQTLPTETLDNKGFEGLRELQDTGRKKYLKSVEVVE